VSRKSNVNQLKLPSIASVKERIDIKIVDVNLLCNDVLLRHTDGFKRDVSWSLFDGLGILFIDSVIIPIPQISALIPRYSRFHITSIYLVSYLCTVPI
jgi:hypothetical protein